MRTKPVWSRLTAAAMSAATVCACASRPPQHFECEQPAPKTATFHLAAAPDSALLAQDLGVLIVHIHADDSIDSYAKYGALRASIDVADADSLGATHRAFLRETNIRGVLAADGLRPGPYELTVRRIGYVAWTGRVFARAGYSDTVFVTQNARMICLDQRLSASRRAP